MNIFIYIYIYIIICIYIYIMIIWFIFRCYDIWICGIFKSLRPFCLHCLQGDLLRVSAWTGSELFREQIQAGKGGRVWRAGAQAVAEVQGGAGLQASCQVDMEGDPSGDSSPVSIACCSKFWSYQFICCNCCQVIACLWSVETICSLSIACRTNFGSCWWWVLNL